MPNNGHYYRHCRDARVRRGIKPNPAERCRVQAPPGATPLARGTDLRLACVLPATHHSVRTPRGDAMRVLARCLCPLLLEAVVRQPGRACWTCSTLLSLSQATSVSWPGCGGCEVPVADRQAKRLRPLPFLCRTCMRTGREHGKARRA
jgi:hypothetical protein